MNELFQHNVKDYFDRLTTRDFINNRNNLQPNPDTEWAIIVSLTVCSYKDREFKDVLNDKRGDLLNCICAGYLENFERFNDDPQITGLYYFYKCQILRQKTKLNQIKNLITTQANRSLKNKLISLAKSFNSYKRSFDSKQALYHGVTDILSLFTPNSLSIMRDSINSLRKSLDETFKYKNVNLNLFKLKDYDSNLENTFNFMYEICSYVNNNNNNKDYFTLKEELTLPNAFKEDIRVLIDELDTTINEIPAIFEESTFPYIVKIDFFLQCSWLVSLIYTTIAHPTAQMFKAAYLPNKDTLPPDTLSSLPLEDDEKLESIINQMGEKKQSEFQQATEILDLWRSELRNFDKRYQKLYFSDQENQNIIESIETKQLNEEETDEDEDELQNITFKFPDEFSSFPKSMKEIKEIIEEHIIKFFKEENDEEEENDEYGSTHEEYENEGNDGDDDDGDGDDDNGDGDGDNDEGGDDASDD